MRNITNFLATAAVALVGGTGMAAAQSLDYWGSAGGWDILVDPSLGYGCLIQAEYNNGSVVRIGFDRNQGTGYVTAFHDDWGDITEGEVYPVAFDLDNEPYDGEGVGIYVQGIPGVDIHFTNPEFLFDLARRYTMTLYNESGEVMAIDLDGSYVGLEGVIECQNEYG